MTASPPSATDQKHAIEPSETYTKATIPITVGFSGGLELLFNNTRTHRISLPATSSPPTVADLIAYLSKTFHAGLPKARRDLFSLDPEAEQDMQDAEGLSKDGEGNIRRGLTVRPGILVLVNDADWELDEERETKLESGDEVVFVSTLHGG